VQLRPSFQRAFLNSERSLFEFPRRYLHLGSPKYHSSKRLSVHIEILRDALKIDAPMLDALRSDLTDARRQRQRATCRILSLKQREEEREKENMEPNMLVVILLSFTSSLHSTNTQYRRVNLQFTAPERALFPEHSETREFLKTMYSLMSWIMINASVLRSSHRYIRRSCRFN